MSSTHSQVNMDILGPPPAANDLLKDGGLITSSPCPIFQESLEPAKKQTRKWAAWTRQEEEHFFSALRQVGKNFVKITNRVQSKNKDQVRHYYYRLVRRMNKLLGPRLSLDAKNSKDTVAAMLRWWTLLEKFSCTISKLRMKPRRFKIFIETLENQLLKDRNKTRRKRSSQGESCVDTSSTSSVINRAPTSDARPVKVLDADSQNFHKKGASSRRNACPSVSSNKGDLPTTKTVRQKRGGVASAAYKRWEKAAMAGVALVADAAEQMERAADQGNFVRIPTEIHIIDGNRDISSVGKIAHSLASPDLVSCQIRETTLPPSVKLKLQLFPIDEGTRKALEKDAHNPHLELTLSSRKRISSVLEHLNRKWGNSTIGMGELMLLPYSSQQDDKATHQRWTARDTDASTADVYASVGSPSIFRLRYGWFSGAEVGSGIVHVPSEAQFESQMQHNYTQELPDSGISDTEKRNGNSPGHATPTDNMSDTSGALVQSNICTVKPTSGCCPANSKDGPPNLCAEMPSSCLVITGDGNRVTQPQDMANLQMRNHPMLSTGDWADCLTTISVGDLLSEASRAGAFASPTAGREYEQIPFSCDSFDAAIAAQISGHQHPSLSTEVSHATMWNAEETCDEFSFQTVPAFKGKSLPPFDPSVGAYQQDGYLADIPECEPLVNPCNNPEENICTSDIYWPDSLGPFEFEMPSTRYQESDIVFGESLSLGGLNRLIANSVDAFQNCSFFGMDNKEISTGEARGVSVLSGNTIGGED